MTSTSSGNGTVSATALGMKPQVLMPLQPGAKNPMDSAQILQQKNNMLQNELTKVGGRRRTTTRRGGRRRGRRRYRTRYQCARGCGSRMRRRRRTQSRRRRQSHNYRRTRSYRRRHRHRGGATTTVPYVSTYGVPDGGATANNMKAITAATVNQNVQSGFDACVGQGPSCTANVYNQQQQILK